MAVTGDGAEITVILIPQADGDLARLHDRTGMSRTDLVNRAVSLYEFIDAQTRDGAEVVVRAADGTEKAMRLL